MTATLWTVIVTATTTCTHFGCKLTVTDWLLVDFTVNIPQQTTTAYCISQSLNIKMQGKTSSQTQTILSKVFNHLTKIQKQNLNNHHVCKKLLKCLETSEKQATNHKTVKTECCDWEHHDKHAVYKAAVLNF